jgi:hypothetical protein
MLMNEVKQFFRNFRQYPALGIALAIVVIAILYYVYKQNSGATPSANITASSANIPEELIYSFMGPTGPAGPAGPTGPTGPTATPIVAGPAGTLIAIRQRSVSGPDASYDANATGVPIQGQKQDHTDIGVIPFGTVIQVNGPAQTGGTNHPASGAQGTNLWYPVTYNGKTGFVNAYDV